MFASACLSKADFQHCVCVVCSAAMSRVHSACVCMTVRVNKTKIHLVDLSRPVVPTCFSGVGSGGALELLPHTLGDTTLLVSYMHKHERGCDTMLCISPSLLPFSRLSTFRLCVYFPFIFLLPISSHPSLKFQFKTMLS